VSSKRKTKRRIKKGGGIDFIGKDKNTMKNELIWHNKSIYKDNNDIKDFYMNLVFTTHYDITENNFTHNIEERKFDSELSYHKYSNKKLTGLFKINILLALLDLYKDNPQDMSNVANEIKFKINNIINDKFPDTFDTYKGINQTVFKKNERTFDDLKKLYNRLLHIIIIPSVIKQPLSFTASPYIPKIEKLKRIKPLSIVANVEEEAESTSAAKEEEEEEERSPKIRKARINWIFNC
jgi:hypothetical protein